MRKELLFVLLMVLMSSIVGQNRIVINKPALTLYVITASNDTVYTTQVGIGRNYGNKRKEGDARTPEGTFVVNHIVKVNPAAFNPNPFGPYFIHVDIPGVFGIGIHGNNNEASIGTRCSGGCIRLHNKDIVNVVKLVKAGDMVIILPDTAGGIVPYKPSPMPLNGDDYDDCIWQNSRREIENSISSLYEVRMPQAYMRKMNMVDTCVVE
ncbi:MAG: L,D-transpeptidase [Bacteroidales bacterium]|nr:L,D-transpeptidase [Bacteroidales bacterium]